MNPRQSIPPALDAAIHAYYAQAQPGPRKVLCLEYGVSYEVLRRRVRELGYQVPPQPRKWPWGAVEEAYLREHTHQTPGQIRGGLYRLTGIKRSVRAIQQHRVLIDARYDPEDPDTWSARRLATMMGVSPDTVERWILRGWLRSRRSAALKLRGGGHIITRADLRDFLIEHPTRWDHRGVHHLFLVEILAGRVGPGVEGMRRAA